MNKLELLEEIRLANEAIEAQPTSIAMQSRRPDLYSIRRLLEEKDALLDIVRLSEEKDAEAKRNNAELRKSLDAQTSKLEAMGKAMARQRRVLRKCRGDLDKISKDEAVNTAASDQLKAVIETLDSLKRAMKRFESQAGAIASSIDRAKWTL